MYKLEPTQDDSKLFFLLNGEAAERHGAIGYLRAAFDGNGSKFYSTWHDCQKHLKTQTFKLEFYFVIQCLRDDRPEPPFANRRSLEAFCAATPGKKLASGNGYMIRTDDYSYYFRCLPYTGNYEIDCLAYDNRYLLPELMGQHDIPKGCCSLMPSSGEIILIRRGEQGYTPISYQNDCPEHNRLFVDAKNTEYGITRAQEEAMLAGSMFGWDVPGAKPWRYDMNGGLVPSPPKKDEPVR